ncbi:MAG TPA: sigma-70 family RNA polymerase sigma factor [Mycobacterium sp.]|nr:sigma-70 family RNA polymerase sigma factor [Mycobacterium sp.]
MAAAASSHVDEPDSAWWLAQLRDPRGAAHGRLHEMLLRAAWAETSRRSGQLRISGPEIDDLAFQAAADAMISILRKLDTFRGESRFTTWAYKFVIFEVSNKLGRHFWANPPERLDTEQWERLPDQFGYSPEDAAQSSDLFDTIRATVERELTAHQRDMFVAVVVNQIPLDALCANLGTNRNAIYKTIFDARRKIRTSLVANGYIEEHSRGVRQT